MEVTTCFEASLIKFYLIVRNLKGIFVQHSSPRKIRLIFILEKQLIKRIHVDRLRLLEDSNTMNQSAMKACMTTSGLPVSMMYRLTNLIDIIKTYRDFVKLII